MGKSGRQSENDIESKTPKTEYRPSGSQNQINKVIVDDIYQLRKKVSEIPIQDDSNLTLDITTEASQAFTPTSEPACESPILQRVGGASTGMSNVFCTYTSGDYTYLTGLCVGGAPTLQIWNTFDTTSPFKISDTLLAQEIRDFIIHGHYFYGCNDGATGVNLVIIDVIKPETPVTTATINTDPINAHPAKCCFAQGNFVYVGASGSISTIDITDPFIPVLYGQYVAGFIEAVDRIYAQGNWLYSSESPNSGFGTYRIDDPANISVAGGVATSSTSPTGCYAANNYAYVCGSSGGSSPSFVDIINFSTPATLSILANVEIDAVLNKIVAFGNSLIASANEGLFLIDVSIPNAPKVRKFRASPNGGSFQTFYVQGRHCFATEIVGLNNILQIFRIGGFKCDNIQTGTLRVEEEATFEIVRARHVKVTNNIIANSIMATKGPIVTGESVNLGPFKLAWWLGDPNGNVTAKRGSLCMSDGSATFYFWVKTISDDDLNWIGVF